MVLQPCEEERAATSIHHAARGMSSMSLRCTFTASSTPATRMFCVGNVVIKIVFDAFPAL